MIVLDLDKDQPASFLDLTKDVPQLKKLRGELNWDPHPLHPASTESGFDLDIFIFCLNDQGKVTSAADVVYFKNKHHASGAISVPVDNQTGEGDDDEFFLMDLEALPAQYASFDVYIFIHEAAKRGQNFGMVANTRFDILDDETGNTEVRYLVTQQFSNETCLHAVSIVKDKVTGHITVQPVGTGAVLDPNQVVALYM